MLAFALAGIGTWAWRNFGATHAASGPVIPPGAKTVVYYFHTNYRCAACLKMEALTKKTVETDFAAAVKDGWMIFRSVNVDTAGNEHFTQDYGLKAQSVVLLAPGPHSRWKNLDRVWDESTSDVGYQRYIQTEITNFLAGGS